MSIVLGLALMFSAVIAVGLGATWLHDVLAGRWGA